MALLRAVWREPARRATAMTLLRTLPRQDPLGFPRCAGSGRKVTSRMRLALDEGSPTLIAEAT